MKLKTMFLTAAAGICACAAMTMAVSGFLDMGDASSYYVRADLPTDNNRSSKFAWVLQQKSPTRFYYKIAGDGTVNISFRKWEFWSDPIIGAWYYQTKSQGYDLPTTDPDDYYAEIEYVKGSEIYGYTQFSKR